MSSPTIFKITKRDRSKKSLVFESTVNGIIKGAVKKLGLPSDAEYKLVLESDGTDIQDDEVLEHMGEVFPRPIFVMILPATEEWIPQASNRPGHDLAVDGQSTIPELHPGVDATDIGNAPMGSGPSLSPPSPPNQLNKRDSPVPLARVSLTSSQRTITPLPLNRLCPNLRKVFDEKRRPTPRARRAMLVVIGDYLMDEKKDVSRGAAREMAQTLVRKFPASFVDKIGDKIVGNGVESLTDSIYYRTTYLKICRNAETPGALAQNGTQTSKKRKRASEPSDYGCVNPAPMLPDDESQESQINQKRLLSEEVHKSVRDEIKIEEWLQKTYASQRVDMNNREVNVGTVFDEWPLLGEGKYFVRHCMELFHKEDIYDFFLSQLKKYSRMVEFMRNECILLTRKKKKVANPDSRISSIREVLRIVSTNDGDERIRGIASVMLIVHHFQEDMTLLFQVVNSTTSDEELETKFGTTYTPLLIVKGESLFDENGRFFIMIDGQVCIEVESAIQGIFCLFTSYYVFNLKYPDQLGKTLEFLQRAVFDINPEEGSRRKTAKRAKSLLDSKVMKLSEDLSFYINN